MLINETSKITNLTKKAIEYYTEQNLVFPVMLNGYRDFSSNDIECRLQKNHPTHIEYELSDF